MFVTDTMPAACSHCQDEISASTYREDFFAGSELKCSSCGTTFRYGTTEALTERAEPPARDKTTHPIHCTQCCQPLPPGMKHPRYFCQNSLTPDLTDVHDLHGELQFILAHINTVSDVLMEILDPKPDRLLFGLYQLLSQLADEAELRAIRLRNAGLYWQQEDRNDGSPFPDLPSPRKHDLHGETCGTTGK